MAFAFRSAQRAAIGAIVTAVLVFGAACGGPQSTAAVASPTPSVSPSATPGAAVTPTPSPVPPTQRMERSLPVALEESAAASLGGKLYVVGGFDAAGNSLRTVWVFDGTGWSSGPPLPIGLDHASAAELGGHVYVAGGHSFGQDSALVFRLDGASWTRIASLHHARGGHAMLALGNRLYVLGGNSAMRNIAPAEVFSPQTRSWHDLPPMPAPRNHVSGFAFGSEACAAGGRSPSTARVDCYDPALARWVPFPNLPLPTSGAGATMLADGTVVVLGGQDAQESRLVTRVAWLGGSKTWSTTGSMLVPRHGFELAIFEGRAWACGGGSSPGLHPVATCTSVV